MAKKQALIITTTASAADSSDFPTVTGMEITATEPEHTATRYLIKTDDTWQKYDTTNSIWVDATEQNLTAASVMSEGNTATVINNLPEAAFSNFTGKTVNVAAALQTTDTSVQPTVTSITVKGRSGAQTLSKTVTHDTVTLADAEVEIVDIHVETEEVGEGKATVQASIQKADNSWTEYQSYDNFVTSPATTAKAIKFRSVLSVRQMGVDSVRVVSISVKHRTDNVAVISEGTGVVLTKTYNFVNSISRAHLMVKHPIVQDTEVTAQISLREAPHTVTGEVLGNGTGAAQTVTLAHNDSVASHNFALYFDGVQQSAANYSFSPTDGQVTFNAPEGVSVTADYVYGWTKEQFVDMLHDTEYPDKNDNNLVDDQFDYVAGDDGLKGSVGTVRVTLIQHTGTVHDEALGTGTGSQQSFKLAHHAKAETITVTPAEATWRFKDNTDVLQVTAPQGEAISVSYDWAARTNYLDSIACIFNE